LSHFMCLLLVFSKSWVSYDIFKITTDFLTFSQLSGWQLWAIPKCTYQNSPLHVSKPGKPGEPFGILWSHTELLSGLWHKPQKRNPHTSLIPH
jgi:hypothetical protein